MSISTTAPKTARGKNGRRSAPWRMALRVGLILVAVLVTAGTGMALYLQGKWSGTTGLFNNFHGITQTFEAIRNPEKFFPGQDHITVLCLGLDRNIIISRDPRINGQPSTKNSRSDVMMVASLDLVNKTAAILSIPRDTRIEYPGHSWGKINEAHSRGGIPYTRQVVQRFLGVPIDYTVVIKQEAIMEVVKAVGGVKVKVDHEMDYDDNWGQLHIHLKPGEQVLDGEQVVGFMRFRHDAEGDFGRIKRQQRVIQALAEKAQDIKILMKAAPLIEAIRQQVHTNLSAEQQVALAHIFHKMQMGNIVTASLPALDTPSIDGISYVIPDNYKKEAMVDWIIRGNKDAMNRLITVDLKNASGDRQLYDKVYDCLRHYGFEVRRAGRVSEELESSRVVQCTNLRGAGRRVVDVLNAHVPLVETSDKPGPDVTLYVGRDLENSITLAASDSWPSIPVRPRQERFVWREASSRRHKHDPDSDAVTIRSVEETPEEEHPAEGDRPLSVPGAAESQPPGGDPGASPTTSEPPKPETPKSDPPKNDKPDKPAAPDPAPATGAAGTGARSNSPTGAQGGKPADSSEVVQ